MKNTMTNVQIKILAQVCLFIVWSYSLITVEGSPVCPLPTHFTISYPSNPEKKETCRLCPICPPAYGLPIQCGNKVPNDTSTDCKPCPNGTFSKNNDSSECKSCDNCKGRYVQQPCSSRENSKCGTCLPGYYLDPNVDDCKECFFCCDDVLEGDHLKECKDLGMPWNMQCEANDANKKCKFKAILLNRTTAMPITTVSPLSNRTGAIGSTGTAIAPSVITANNRTTARPITTVSPLSKRTGAIGSTGTAIVPREITANNRTTARPMTTVSPLSKRTGAIGSTGTAIAPSGITANYSTTKNASKLHPVPMNETEIINESVGEDHDSSGGGTYTIAGLVAGGILLAIIAMSCFVVKKWRQSGCGDQVYNSVRQGGRHVEAIELQILGNKYVTPHQNNVNGNTPPLSENQSTESSITSSTELLHANKGETTGRDNLNIDHLRIPEERVVSDMEWLRDHSGSPMLFQVQSELDAFDTIQNRTWRSVGRVLGVTTQKLNLIETCYKAGKSPTEELVEHLKTRGKTEPKMRTFVMVLIACKKIDLARTICNWPWEINQGNDSN